MLIACIRTIQSECAHLLLQLMQFSCAFILCRMKPNLPGVLKRTHILYLSLCFDKSSQMIKCSYFSNQFLSQNVTAFSMHMFYWFLISPTLKWSFCFPFMLEIFLILINWNSFLSYIKTNFKITFQKLVLASLMTTFIDVRATVERKWKWANPHRRTLGWTKRRAKGIVYLQGDLIVGGCQFHLSRQTLSLV